MMRSLYSGVSGLKNHQTRMDVIGNNIANVNTVGYKKSRVVFKDAFYQTMRAASTPTAERGGTNPMGIGLGVNLASIDQIHTPSAPTTTNKTTDMAVDGNGYFILNGGGMNYYTRAGAFDFDDSGKLVSTANGYTVQGWNADDNFVLNPTGDTEAIDISNFLDLPSRATSNMSLAGNLDSALNFLASRNEVQNITFSDVPNGGTPGGQFTLTVGPNTTGAIAVGINGTATAANMQAALEGLPNIGTGNVSVSWNQVRGSYNIEFNGTLSNTDMPDITFNPGAGFDGGTAAVTTTTESQIPISVLPVNEQQALDLITAAGGNFTLSYGGVNSAAIAFDADAATIQAALEAIPALNGNINVQQVTAPAVGISGGQFTVTFTNNLAGTNVETLGITNNAGCTGTMATNNQGQPAGNPAGVDSITTSKDVFDSQGNRIPAYFRFFKYEIVPGSNPGVVPVVQPITRWACDVSLDPLFEQQTGYLANADLRTIDISGTVPPAAAGDEKMTRIYNINFDQNGVILNPDTSNAIFSINRQVPPPGTGTANVTIDVDLQNLTQFASERSARVESQNGYAAGKMVTYDIARDGTIKGVYNNEQTVDLARVALRNFQNPSGLKQMGGTLFQETSNSGGLPIDVPGQNGLGMILPGSLEMSNVDLSEEFTDMIITQRGFQANSRIITTSDEMLQELVNLKR